MRSDDAPTRGVGWIGGGRGGASELASSAGNVLTVSCSTPFAGFVFSSFCLPVIFHSKQDPITKGFKRTLIYLDTNTQHANVRGNPLFQATKL